MSGTSAVRAMEQPPAHTLFVGRRHEVEEITTRLRDPACRLLTLVGLGGIGKTALARHVIDRFKTEPEIFPHGAYLVPMQAVESPGLFPIALADALGIALASTQAPLDQLGHYLHDKALLLVLDSLEHLLASVDHVATLLSVAPAVKVMVTSREVLNLREEWLYPVQGLAYPQDGQANGGRVPDDRVNDDRVTDERVRDDGVNDGTSYSAVQLFCACARRVRPDFSPQEELPAIVRICRLVEGTPLAIELAASWVNTLGCAEIAEEIAHSIDFLTSHLHNMLDRHRSILAVFEPSWAQLTAAEQGAFMRLCTFRGDFDRKAAAAIADASLPVLASLVDKSLVQIAAHGRYRIHELLRQYAQAKLAQNTANVEQAYAAHCHYYLAWLAALDRDMGGGRQLEAAREIALELANVRAAIEWAIAHGVIDSLVQWVQAYALFCQFGSRYQEGATTFAAMLQAIEQLEPTEEVVCGQIMLIVAASWLYIRLGRLSEAERLLMHGRALYVELDIGPVSGDSSDPAAPLGVICLIRGDYAGAAALGAASLQWNRAAGHLSNMRYAHYVLAGAALAQGDEKQAHYHAYQTYTLADRLQDSWFKAYCLIEMGRTEQATGNLSKAADHYRASYALRQAFNDPEGMAVALTHLAQIALEQGNHAEAQQLYTQSRTIYEEINDRGGLVTALDGLGTVAVALGDHAAAAHYFYRALQLAVDMQFVRLLFSLFVHSAELFLQTGDTARGVVLLTLTRDHPAGPREATTQAAQRLAAYPDAQPSITPPAATSAQESSAEESSAEEPAADVAAIAANLLADLSVLAHPIGLDAPDALSAPAPASDDEPDQAALVEPLTERELEVLRLLVEGWSNREIADKLIVAIGTVKAHNHNIFGKLGVNNRTSAVQRAHTLNLG